MFTHEDLRTLQSRSLKMQGWIRQQTFSPENEKTLRRFSSWEVAELILGLNQSTFRGRLAADPTFPAGKVEPDGRQRWFSLEEVNTLRRKLSARGKSLMPQRPPGARLPRRHRQLQGRRRQVHRRAALRPCRRARRLPGAAASTSTRRRRSRTPWASPTSAEEQTVWGIMARDLIRETDRMNARARRRRLGHRPAPPHHPRLDPRPRPAGAAHRRLHPADQLADDRHHPLLRQRRLRRVRLGPVPPPQPRVVVLRRRLALPRPAAGRRLGPDLLRLPAGHRLPVDERGLRRRHALSSPRGPATGSTTSTTSFIGQLAEALEDLSRRVRGRLPRGEDRAAQGLPRHPLPADPLRAEQRTAPRHAARPSARSSASAWPSTRSR